MFGPIIRTTVSDELSCIIPVFLGLAHGRCGRQGILILDLLTCSRLQAIWSWSETGPIEAKPTISLVVCRYGSTHLRHVCRTWRRALKMVCETPLAEISQHLTRLLFLVPDFEYLVLGMVTFEVPFPPCQTWYLVSDNRLVSEKHWLTSYS